MLSSLIVKIEEIQKLKEEIIEKINSTNDEQSLKEIRVKYLGKKGIINSLFDKISLLPKEEKPQYGILLNQIKAEIETIFKNKFEELSYKKEKEKIDITLPPKTLLTGSIHILSQVIEEIKQIFSGLGFTNVEGPEIESEYYNFDALNTPEDHPARDMWSTLYIKKDILLRTHTSPVQIRVMEKQKPPIQMISIGKCYRADPPDASHSPVFFQVEGLMVDEHITFCHLKGILTLFFNEFFNKDVNIRFIPSFFPFTEPSAEVSISCVICDGKGCSTCGHTGWLELVGAGMVNPKVFQNVGYDPEKYTGFAFGCGVDRLAMIKYRINDIRHFYENDLRFLHQFL